MNNVIVKEASLSWAYDQHGKDIAAATQFKRHLITSTLNPSGHTNYSLQPTDTKTTDMKFNNPHIEILSHIFKMSVKVTCILKGFKTKLCPDLKFVNIYMCACD